MEEEVQRWGWGRGSDLMGTPPWEGFRQVSVPLLESRRILAVSG